MSDGPFSGRRAGILVAVAAVSLAAAAFLGIFGDELSQPASFGTDVYSRSAIGHHAFAALLRQLGVRVLVSRNRTAEKAQGEAVLAVLEPQLEISRGPRRGLLDDIAAASRHLFVVLPKRTGAPAPSRPRWLGAADLLPLAQIRTVLEVIAIDGDVVRPAHSSNWRGLLPTPNLDEPQLLQDSNLTPLLETDDGILAGELKYHGQHLIVLADPDLIATHGLNRGENAVIVMRLLERLGVSADSKDPLVLDETLHGNALTPSLLRELFRFPLVLATWQALLALALLSWVALVRFGRPARPAPGLAPGKAFLVQNTADLLSYGHHLSHAVAAYLRAAKEVVAQRLRLPGDRADSLDAWLERVAAARGRADVLANLEARAHAQPDRGRGAEEEAVRTARAIYEFREEMTDGADGNSRRYPAAQG